MGLVNLAPLVASPHTDNGRLGQDDGPSDDSGYLLTALNKDQDDHCTSQECQKP